MSANANQPQQQQNRKFCVVPGAPTLNSPQRQQVTVTRTFTTMSTPAALATAVAQCAPAKASSSNAAEDASRSSSKCTHASHTVLSDVTSMQQISTEHYQQQLKKYRDEAALCGGDAAKMNGQINEIFVKRLQDIDAHAEGDNDLKLITYQEWIDLLLKINETLITNMEDLESEVAERLEMVQRKVNTNCRNSQGNELARCRKDICALLKIIQNAYHNDNWSIQGVQFETLTHAQVLGLNEGQQQCVPRIEGGAVQSNANAECSQQQNKLIGNVKALAVEVAERYDEILELKKQVLCMEDEIQKAQKKIQLKDDVIKELRNDLKNASAKPTNKNTTNVNTLATYTEMPPVNFDLSQGHTSRSAATQVSAGLNLDNHQMAYLNDDVSQTASLSQNEQVEYEKRLELEEELKGLFEVMKDLKKQNFEDYRKRFSDIFQKSEAEKAEAFRKLQYMRNQLLELEVNVATPNIRITKDDDSGFSSKSENDPDAKIIEAVRQKLLKLNELKKRIQDLEVEKNAISAKLEARTSLAQRDSDALKEVADFLSQVTGKTICYRDIYNAKSEQLNPFCKAILQFKQRQEDQFKQLEEELCCHIKSRDNKIGEMQEYLEQREKELQQLGNIKKAHECSDRGSRSNNSTNTASQCSTTNFSYTMTTQQDNEKTQSQQPKTTLQRQQHSKPTATATPAHTQTKSQQVRQQQPVDKHFDKETDADAAANDNDDNTTAWNW